MNILMLWEHTKQAQHLPASSTSHRKTSLCDLKDNGFSIDFEREAFKRIHSQQVYVRNQSTFDGPEVESTSNSSAKKDSANLTSTNASPITTKNQKAPRKPKPAKKKKAKAAPVQVPQPSLDPVAQMQKFEAHVALYKRKSMGGPGSVFPTYRGDVFGTHGNYEQGQVYRSRIIQPKMQLLPAQVALLSELAAMENKTKGEAAVVTSAEESQHRAIDPKVLEAAHRSTSTIRNWSFHAENVPKMVEEGALRVCEYWHI